MIVLRLALRRVLGRSLTVFLVLLVPFGAIAIAAVGHVPGSINELPRGILGAGTLQSARTLVGVLTLAVFLLALFTARDLAGDMESGAFRRMRAYPRGASRYAARYGAALGLTVTVQVFLALVTMGVVFRMDPLGMADLLVLLSVLGLVAAAMASAIAIRAGTRARVGMLAAFVVVPMVLLGGALWPLRIMPPAMQYVAFLVPVAWAMDAATGILNGGGPGAYVYHLAVLGLFAALFLFHAWWSTTERSGINTETRRLEIVAHVLLYGYVLVRLSAFHPPRVVAPLFLGFVAGATAVRAVASGNAIHGMIRLDAVIPIGVLVLTLAWAAPVSGGRDFLLSLLVLTAAALLVQGKHRLVCELATARTQADKVRARRYEQDRNRAHSHRDARELIHAAELQERERISHALHDTVGHRMTGVLMQLQATEKLLQQSGGVEETVPERLQRCVRELSETLELMRDTVHDLRPRSATAVERIQRATRSFAFCPVTLDVSPDIEQWNPAHAHEIARALEEALTNVARHSDATRVTVTVETDENIGRLIVADNGRGPRSSREGLGLSGIRSRVERLGGTITTGSEEGFRLCVTLPVQEYER